MIRLLTLVGMEAMGSLTSGGHLMAYKTEFWWLEVGVIVHVELNAMVALRKLVTRRTEAQVGMPPFATGTVL